MIYKVIAFSFCFHSLFLQVWIVTNLTDNLFVIFLSEVHISLYRLISVKEDLRYIRSNCRGIFCARFNPFYSLPKLDSSIKIRLFRRCRLVTISLCTSPPEKAARSWGRGGNTLMSRLTSRINLEIPSQLTAVAYLLNVCGNLWVSIKTQRMKNRSLHNS